MDFSVGDSVRVDISGLSYKGVSFGGSPGVSASTMGEVIEVVTGDPPKYRVRLVGMSIMGANEVVVTEDRLQKV